ncbi:Exportin-6 [Manis pentadactyla]|nr:Exportin-6 [Manis pentadactyla]
MPPAGEGPPACTVGATETWSLDVRRTRIRAVFRVAGLPLPLEGRHLHRPCLQTLCPSRRCGRIGSRWGDGPPLGSAARPALRRQRAPRSKTPLLSIRWSRPRLAASRPPSSPASCSQAPCSARRLTEPPEELR